MCSIQNQVYFDTDLKVGFLNKGKIMDMYPETIDAIIISNSTTMLGLPYIIDHFNFKGKIFATEPTIQFGGILMRDIAMNMRSLPKSDKSLNLNSSEFLRLNSTFSSLDMSTLYSIYNEKTVQSCIGRMQQVHFNEPLNLFGLLTIRALCSGYSIGSCNWLIESSNERIGYISHSSAIVSHVRSLDTESMKNVDVLIVGSVVQTVVPPIERLCDEMCERMCETIKSGGNVLVPISMCGLIFDIVEKMYTELSRRNLERTQMFMLSSQATTSLAYANIYGEWLNGQRESQLYNADSPFVFDKLTRTNMLTPCDDITGIFNERYRSPSIVFASHPSLRMGPVVHLMRLWGSDCRNGLFLVDTVNHAILHKKDRYMHDIERTLSPFCPLEMSVHYYPLENGIRVSEVPALLERLSLPTKALILPFQCSGSAALTKISESVKTFYLTTNKFIEIVLPDDQSATEEIIIAQSLSDAIKPIVIDADTNLAIIHTRIVQKDGRSELTVASTNSHPRFLLGALDSQKLIEQLHKRGLTDAKCEVLEDDRRFLIYFSEEDSLIQVNDNSTHVICEDEEMRKKIQEALVACLHSVET